MPRPGFHLATLLVVGVLILGACNGFKLFRSTDDRAITTDVQAKLFTDPALKTRDIHVDSHEGIVTLSGSVGTDLEKAAVERIATQEDGVKNVVNMLNVASNSAPPISEGVQTTESVATPPQAVPPTAPPKQTAPQPSPPKTPRPAHHDQPLSSENKATADLQAYTNSVTPEANPNPNPPAAPAPAPTPVAAAPSPPALPQAVIAPSTPAPSAPAPTPAAPASVASPAAAPKPQEHLTILSGTVLTIRVIDNIDSSRNKAGEEFAATLDAPVVVDDRVLASRGSDARVRLVDAKSAGTMSGQSELQLELINVTINGVSYATHSGY